MDKVINGVDVSGCEFSCENPLHEIKHSCNVRGYEKDNGLHIHLKCKNNPDCYYKQLKRLQAENEQLLSALQEIREIAKEQLQDVSEQCINTTPMYMVPRSKYQQWKYDNKYRKADSDKRCKNCKNRFITHSGEKVYYKCILLGMSSCSATDIGLSNVCDLFTPKNADCQLCKHLDCDSDGHFICSSDGEILDHEGIYCSNFEEYIGAEE